MAKMGRPKADVPKQKIVSVRMMPKEYERLKNYAELHEMTITQVVQQGISILLEME